MTKSPVCLLNTRPAHQSAALQSLLSEKGFQSFACPTIKIGLNALSCVQAKKLNSLVSAQEFDLLIITSVNALIGWVNQFPEHFVAHPSNWPHDTGRLRFELNGIRLKHLVSIPVFTIGEATANAAKSLGFAVQTLSRKQFDSEDLLAQLQATQASVFAKPCLQVALLSGVGGRSVIKTQLTNAGAKVTEFEVYRRQPTAFCTQVWQDFIQCDRPVILVSSLESWQRLWKMLCEYDSSYAAFNSKSWQSIEALVVFSSRIQNALQQQGVPRQKIHVTPIQSNDGIVQVLANL